MRKKIILVVENDQQLRELLYEFLTESGFDTYQAIDGHAAFQKIEIIQPDLIITNILMPKVTGDELIKMTRQTEIGRKIPFIVLSERKLMKEYLDTLDVDSFISKPFHPQELLDEIKRVLERHSSLLAQEGGQEKTDAEKKQTQEQKNIKRCGKCGEEVNVSFFRCPGCGSTHFQ